MHQINKWARKDGWVSLRWQAKGDSLNNSRVAVPGTMFAEAGSLATERTCSKNEHWEEMKEKENSSLPCHPTTAVSALFQHSYFCSVHWEQTVCTSIFPAVFWSYNSIWHYLSENSALKQAPAFFPYPLGKEKVLDTQSCLTVCNPMDYTLLGSSVHSIRQARILKWVAIPFSRGSSQPRHWTQVSHIADSLPSEPPGKPWKRENFPKQRKLSTLRYCLKKNIDRSNSAFGRFHFGGF